MIQTLKVSFAICQRARQDSFAPRDEGSRDKPLGSQMTKVNTTRELQPAGGKRLCTLMPSVLQPSAGAFKSEPERTYSPG